MAHGFLSYKDSRGADKHRPNYGNMVSAIRDYLNNRDAKKENAPNLAEEVAALPAGKDPKAILGGSTFANLDGGAQKSIASDRGINPEVMGGSLAKNIVNFGAGRLNAEPRASDALINITPTSTSTDDVMFAKSASFAGSESSDVIQAIDRLTFVTLSLVQATKDQTSTQESIAARQHEQADKLASRALSKAEENQIEQGYDNSWNTPYESLKKEQGGGGGGLVSGAMGLLGAGAGIKSIGKRGLGRAIPRVAARLGGRQFAKRFATKTASNSIKKFGVRQTAKLGIKQTGKGLLKKGLGKAIAKKIPILGLGLGAIFAAQRAMAGDFTGAGLELASGAASTIPGFGTAASVGIDAALIGRDMGMTPFNKGGIVEGTPGIDKVPSLLTKGETVLIPGAREKMINSTGIDPLAFNAKVAGGGFFGKNNNKEKALLNTISFAEGNPGYNTWFGHQNFGGDLSGRTIDQMHDLQGDFLKAGLGQFDGGNSAAVGKYQFTHLKEHAHRMGADTSKQMFTPEFQDQLALFLAREKGVTPELLRSEGLSDDVINKLSPVWASFPGNSYGQPTKTNSTLRGVFNQSKNTKDLEGQMLSLLGPGAESEANALGLASMESVGGVNIINNYYTGSEMGSGSNTGGNATPSMPFGISSSDTGTDIFQEMGLRSLS
jgi:muramidase (phage lysozyme)